MTDSLLSVDPGQVTGWSLWALDDEHPLQRLEYGLVKGGVEGWLTWQERRLGELRPDVIVFENFNPNLGYGGAKDFEALEIKGAFRAGCRALGLEVTFQETDMKALCKDDDLRRLGLWILPSEAKVDPAIMHEDARDVHDSFIHALAWAKASGHEPTVALYWPEPAD